MVSKTGPKKGDKVKIDYEGRFENNEVFDSSKKHGKPLMFEVGAGHVIKGFEDAVMGMKVGEEKEVKISPDKAYGQPKKELIKEIPREQLPADKEPKKGMLLLIGLPNGNKIPAKIASVTKDKIKVDINHPLAGKTLIFKIKLLGVN